MFARRGNFYWSKFLDIVDWIDYLLHSILCEQFKTIFLFLSLPFNLFKGSNGLKHHPNSQKTDIIPINYINELPFTSFHKPFIAKDFPSYKWINFRTNLPLSQKITPKTKIKSKLHSEFVMREYGRCAWHQISKHKKKQETSKTFSVSFTPNPYETKRAKHIKLIQKLPAWLISPKILNIQIMFYFLH